MRLDIAKILERGGRVSESVAVTPLESDAGEPIEARTARIEGILSRGRRGYEFEATLVGGVTLPCVRCLEPFPHDLSFGFHLLLVTHDPGPKSGEHQIQSADCDLTTCPDGKLDLQAVAREQIYLQIPLKPICSESCRGFCQTCRRNLNSGSCVCPRPEAVQVI